MQKITPHLWFDKEAKQAAELYVSTFPNSKITSISSLDGTPSGSVELVNFELAGLAFASISAGPYFKFTPAISFLVACTSKQQVDEIWAKLSPGGMVMMELGSYPFSARYGWVQDRFGLSWQIMFMGDIPFTQMITPTLMFVGNVCGKAEEAMTYYTSLFKNANIGGIMRYQPGEEPDKAGTIKHAEFTLEGQTFAAMDSAHGHKFTFNEAISFIISCKDQSEIDYFWSKLSAVPEAEQCGWVKDRFGISWQIVPSEMDEMMRKGSKEQVDRLTQAFLKMKKFDLATLRQVYNQK